MKRNILVISYLLFSTILPAQKIFVHVGAGVMNYSGDLQSKVYTLNQADADIQVGVGYQFSQHFTVNYFIATGKLKGSDAKTNVNRTPRNLSFYSSIGETAFTLEASLTDVTGVYNFTPYVFAGMGLFRMDPYTLDDSAKKVYLNPLHTEGQGLPEYPDRKPYKLVNFTIPFGFGFKYALSENLILSAEFGFRKTFTDYIDDVSSRTYADTALLSANFGQKSADLSFRADEIPGNPYELKAQRGNPDKKDFYYNILFKVSFSFDKSIFQF